MPLEGEQHNSSTQLVFKCSETRVPPVIRRVLSRKGWREWDKDTDDESVWSLHWKSGRFKLSDWDKCLPHQRLNHCPKSSGITKKDNLHRNIKRLAGSYGKIFDFIPTTFVLPNEYLAFMKAFSDRQDNDEEGEKFWICKPSDSSRGRGIFIISHISQLVYDQQYVVQEYISRPLTVGGFKFDLRLYVLVTSFHPLRCFCYHEGLVRFATEKYSREEGSLNNLYAHLTNSSINKHSPSFNSYKETVGAGSKWPISKLREYFKKSGVDDEGVWGRITNIIVLTILALWPKIPHQDSGFELLGFDIMIDDDLIPWLIEVNSSPALATESQLDCQVKEALISDTIDLLNIQPRAPTKATASSRTSLLASSSTSSCAAHVSPAPTAAAAAAAAAGLPPAAVAAAAANAAQAAPTMRVGSRLPHLARPPSASSSSSVNSATTSASTASNASTVLAGGAGASAGGSGGVGVGEGGRGKSLACKERVLVANGMMHAAKAPVRPPFGGGGGRDLKMKERAPLPPCSSLGASGGGGSDKGTAAGWARAGVGKIVSSRAAGEGARGATLPGARRLSGGGGDEEEEEVFVGDGRSTRAVSLERGGKVRIGLGAGARSQGVGAGEDGVGVGVGVGVAGKRGVGSASSVRAVGKPPLMPTRSHSASSTYQCDNAGPAAALSAALDSLKGPRHRRLGESKKGRDDDEEDEDENDGEEDGEGEDGEEEDMWQDETKDALEEWAAPAAFSPRSMECRSKSCSRLLDNQPGAFTTAPTSVRGTRNSGKPPVGGANVSGGLGAGARGRVGVTGAGSAGARACSASRGGGRDAEVIAQGRGAGGTGCVDKGAEEGGSKGGDLGVSNCQIWGNRGPDFGDKVPAGINGFRLVFPFNEESCQLAGAAERKAGHKGNVDIRALIEVVKQSEAKFRQHVRAAGRKLSSHIATCAFPESAAAGERGVGISGVAGMSGMMASRSGANASAEPWWMAPSANASHRAPPSPLVS